MLIVRDDPILPIDKMGIAGFWSKTLQMRFLQDIPGSNTDLSWQAITKGRERIDNIIQSRSPSSRNLTTDPRAF
jgi:hypothetical protein